MTLTLQQQFAAACAQRRAVQIRNGRLVWLDGQPPLSDVQMTAALPARTIPAADFIARIPAAVWAKVQAVATPGTNPELSKALFFLAASPAVHSDNAQLLAMLAALVQAGVLTDAERTQILSF